MTWLQQSPAHLDAFRRGERDALSTVYHEHVRVVEVVARRGFILKGQHMVGVPEHEVEDLVQECFIRAFSPQARSAYDPARAYQPYVLQILRNLMIDHARKNKRSLTVVSHEPVDLDALTPGTNDLDMPAPDDLVYWGELRAAYQTFQQDLTPEESTFIQLRYVEESAQREVADTMSVSRRHIRTLETRVRGKLRTFLRSKGLWP